MPLAGDLRHILRDNYALMQNYVENFIKRA